MAGFVKTRAAVALLAVAVLAGPALAQDSVWRTPPQEIVDILDAPPAPFVSLSPTRDALVHIRRESLPPLDELARPMARLAGLRLDVATNGRHGPRNFVGLSFQALDGSPPRDVALPDGAGIGGLRWSPDGASVAFVMTRDDEMSLWVADVATATARPLVERGVNGVFQTLAWTPDGTGLLVSLVPDGRGPEPERARVPAGPTVQDADGYEAPVRTYQDLLTDAQDAALFQWLATSQLARVDIASGRLTPVGTPGVYFNADLAPGGEYILVSRLDRPYSYLVPWMLFPRTTEVWTASGETVATIAALPIADNIPIGGVPTGRRVIGWQASHPARLVWAEALDGGDPRVEIDHRDRVMRLDAPFDGEPMEMLRTQDRYSGLRWLDSGEAFLVYEYDRDTRVSHEWLADAADMDAEPRLVIARNVQDSYADPGTPLTTLNTYGQSVVHVHDGAILRTGSGATPDGDRPFLSRLDLETLETTELWRHDGDSYEEVINITAPDGSAFLIWREDRATPPNVHLRRGDDLTAITDFPDPHPQLSGLHRELITYERADGVTLSATLYLPPDYREGDILPVVVWAYPFEYNDAATAGQMRGSQHRFTRIAGTSPRFLLTQGYALLENATMPVIGADPETVNDTFIEQIVMSAQAAVDATVARGFGDGERVAIAGHSYGAFMTAHLLAQSDIFRTGIARSGAYNRTLTPFGFQSERRTFWEAPETYYELSPFMAAHRINEPVLFIHGEMDNNSGTFPMQSERMFAAVKGTGGTARLVMLPYESHGYSARESVLHVLAETIDWLDRWVKPETMPPLGAGAE